MNQTFEFCDARAREAAAVASAATLDNVRERELRSEAAWRGMADQALKVTEARQVADDERTARRDAEGLSGAEGLNDAEGQDSDDISDYVMR